MKIHAKIILLGCLASIGLALPSAHAEGKKYKRALIIAGGGISPAVGLGVIAGLRQQGMEPDVVLTTCGASISAAIDNSFLNSDATIQFAESPAFFNVMQQVKIASPDVMVMAKKFKELEKNPDVIPGLFDTHILNMPPEVGQFVPQNKFNTGAKGPKFVILSARALFGPNNVGEKKAGRDLFEQVFFTDPETAKELQNLPSPIRTLFPKSNVAKKTRVITDVTTEQAARASVPDPFLLNPAVINGSYYFTGAVDLFPIEVAHQLADEVIVTYPERLYLDYENLVIQSAFGFSQTQRALSAIQDTTVKWIDITGISKLAFSPETSLLTLKNKIPSNQNDFIKGIRAQFEFGKNRAIEGINIQKTQANVRTHLREPINPKLFESFTCQNANVWKVMNKTCTSDVESGCKRTAEFCVPVR